MARIPIYQQDQLASSVVGTAGVDNSALAAAGSLAQDSAALESAQQQANIAQGSAFVQGISSALQNVGQELSALQAARAAADAKKAAIREQAVLAEKLRSFKSKDEDILKELQNENINTPVFAKTRYEASKSLDGFIANDAELSADRVMQDKFRAAAEPIVGENTKRLIDWGDKQDDRNKVNQLKMYKLEAPARIAKANTVEQFERNKQIEFDAINALRDYIPEDQLNLAKAEIEPKAAEQYGLDVASKYNDPIVVDGKTLKHDQQIEKFVRENPMFKKVGTDKLNRIVAAAEEVRKDHEEYVHEQQRIATDKGMWDLDLLKLPANDEDRSSLVSTKQNVDKFVQRLQAAPESERNTKVLGAAIAESKSLHYRINAFDSQERTEANQAKSAAAATLAAQKLAQAETYEQGAGARARLDAGFKTLVEGHKNGKLITPGSQEEINTILDLSKAVQKANEDGYLSKTDMRTYGSALVEKLNANLKTKEDKVVPRVKSPVELFWEHQVQHKTPKNVLDWFNNDGKVETKDKIDRLFVDERNSLLLKYFQPNQVPTKEQLARIDKLTADRLTERLLRERVQGLYDAFNR